MPTLGLDAFVTDIGVAEEKTCRVCGAACDVERSVFGPISLADWAATVSQSAVSRRYHDRFTCPHAHKPWHRQALRLTQEMYNTASPRVAHLIRQDLQEVLAQVHNNRLLTHALAA